MKCSKCGCTVFHEKEQDKLNCSQFLGADVDSGAAQNAGQTRPRDLHQSVRDAYKILFPVYNGDEVDHNDAEKWLVKHEGAICPKS